MANSSYTYTQVLNGTGKFQMETNGAYSGGVKTLQQRLNSIGYDISADGYFGSGTEKAVKAFQTECSLVPVDGIAGKGTLTKLEQVRVSKYFNTYGYPLTSTDWGRDNILNGNFDDIDLLARVIYAENTSDQDDQKGVAIVIRNRKNAGESGGYMEKSGAFPDASVWARVVAKHTGSAGVQYGTTNASCKNAYAPQRGYTGDDDNSDGVADAWANAVDLATKLKNGTTITVRGYKVNGLTVDTSTLVSVTNQKNQISSTHYKNKYKAGDKFSGTVISTAKTLTGNVFCTYA
ncbi:peptidoglycan-binding protein [Dysosmobacter sp.]